MAADECSYLFLVRLWLNADSQTHPSTRTTQEQVETDDLTRRQRWRGKVQPVLGTQTCYFEDWAGLVDALLDMLPQEQDDDVCRQSGPGEQDDDFKAMLSSSSTGAT